MENTFCVITNSGYRKASYGEWINMMKSMYGNNLIKSTYSTSKDREFVCVTFLLGVSLMNTSKKETPYITVFTSKLFGCGTGYHENIDDALKDHNKITTRVMFAPMQMNLFEIIKKLLGG